MGSFCSYTAVSNWFHKQVFFLNRCFYFTNNPTGFTNNQTPTPAAFLNRCSVIYLVKYCSTYIYRVVSALEKSSHIKVCSDLFSPKTRGSTFQLNHSLPAPCSFSKPYLLQREATTWVAYISTWCWYWCTGVQLYKCTGVLVYKCTGRSVLVYYCRAATTCIYVLDGALLHIFAPMSLATPY